MNVVSVSGCVFNEKNNWDLNKVIVILVAKIDYIG